MRWLTWINAALLAVTGILIGANGVLVVVAPSRTRSAYGVAVADVDLVILLRHRAVLLVVIGFGLVLAALRAQVRVVAMCAAAISMATFVLFTFGSEGANTAQRRVAVIDLVLLGVLGVAAVAPRPPGGRRPAGPAR